MLFKLMIIVTVCIFCVIPYITGFDLTILHTNDVHSRFDETNKYGGECTDPEDKCFGGIARQKTLIEQIRQQNPNTLLLDAGDQFQGTLWFYHYGPSIISWSMTQLGYDAMMCDWGQKDYILNVVILATRDQVCQLSDTGPTEPLVLCNYVGSHCRNIFYMSRQALGNHEFDREVKGLVAFLRNVSFPILSSNIDTSKEHKMQQGLFKPYHVFEVGGEKIGVIGYTTRDTPIISSPGSLIFKEEVESIRQQVQILEAQNVNKIIALGHSGFSVDRHIAEQVEGLDIVIGGHTNTFLYNGKEPSNDKPVGSYPTIITQTSGAQVLVVQDYAFGKYLGFLQVTFDDNGVITNYSGNPILLHGNVTKDEYLKNKTEEFGVILQETAKEVVGRTLVYLEGDRFVCRVKECNMGNVIADGFIHQNLKHADSINGTRVYIALVNGGSIRNSFPRGQITVGNIKNAQPFRNSIETMQLQGKYLRQALEHSVKAYNPTEPDGRFLQLSGLRVVYDMSKREGGRVFSVHAKCSDCEIPEYLPLDDNKMYDIAISVFLLNGGDGYTMIKDHAVKQHITENLDSEVLLEYIKASSPITHGIEGRIQFAKDVCNVFVVTSSTHRLSSFNLLLYFLFALVIVTFIPALFEEKSGIM